MSIVYNELFNINPNFELIEERVGEGQHKIVIIKNLFENPDDVYDFIINFPIELNQSFKDDFYYQGPMSINFTPGYIGHIMHEIRPIRRQINWVLSQYFSERRYFKTKARINAFKSGIVGKRRACYPHTDQMNEYSATIYMDKKNLGGTGLFRFKTGIEQAPFTQFYKEENAEYLKWSEHWSLQQETEFDTVLGDENWQMYHMIPNEWNTMAIYEGNLFHNVVLKPDMYQDELRTSINVFTDGEINNA